MKAETKLALRRFALRWLRKLVDVADDRLHAAEVTLRNDLSGLSARQHPTLTVHSSEDLLHQRTDDKRPEAARPESETFLEWEARRSGVAPVSKKAARQRRERQGAAAFDLRYAR
jgi:hypothetical protein